MMVCGRHAVTSGTGEGVGQTCVVHAGPRGARAGHGDPASAIGIACGRRHSSDCCVPLSGQTIAPTADFISKMHVGSMH